MSTSSKLAGIFLFEHFAFKEPRLRLSDFYFDKVARTFVAVSKEDEFV